MTALTEILSAYRADRMPVVASVQRLDSTLRAVVPIDRALVAILRHARQRATDDRVLPWRAVTTAQRHLRRAAERAAVPGVTPHVIRHTMATYLLREVPLIIASRPRD